MSSCGLGSCGLGRLFATSDSFPSQLSIPVPKVSEERRGRRRGRFALWSLTLGARAGTLCELLEARTCSDIPLLVAVP